MRNKAFDCVEMKRRGAELVAQRLAGLTPEQEREYWRRRSDEFQREQDRLAAKPKPAAPVSRGNPSKR